MKAKRSAKTDWEKVWLMAKQAYAAAGMDRHLAVLDNFKDKKEQICRTLNIVGEADIARIQKGIDARGR